MIRKYLRHLILNPISLKYFSVVYAFLILITPIYLQILFFNFKFYESNVDYLKIIYFRELTIKNLLSNLNFKFGRYESISKLANFLIVFVIPTICSIFAVIFLCRVNNYFILAFIIYVLSIIVIYISMDYKQLSRLLL
jgi:hypothetical protein